jgi:pimeloyl-ACP methyl ester carboxylesterase
MIATFRSRIWPLYPRCRRTSVRWEKGDPQKRAAIQFALRSVALGPRSADETPPPTECRRNVILHVADMDRILDPDLIGFGRSGKSPTQSYKFGDHVRYLGAWFDALGLTRDITLVVHDWGSALGFHRAARFPDQIKAVVYMESIAVVRDWSDFGNNADMFKAFRSPKGEEMVLDGTFLLRRGCLYSSCGR